MRLRWIAAGAVLAIGGTAAAVYSLSRDTAEPDRGSIIARVNGEPIYSVHAEARLKSVASDPNHPGSSAPSTESWKRQVFQSLVDDVIILQEAERRHIDVTDSDVDTEVDKVRRLSGEAKDFDKWLKRQAITLAELERRVENNLRWGRVQKAVIGKVTVSDAEIKAYYDKNVADFTDAEGPKPLFEVKPSIREKLVAEKESAAFVSWLTAQRKSVHVEILDKAWAEAK